MSPSFWFCTAERASVKSWPPTPNSLPGLRMMSEHLLWWALLCAGAKQAWRGIQRAPESNGAQNPPLVCSPGKTCGRAGLRMISQKFNAKAQGCLICPCTCRFSRKSWVSVFFPRSAAGDHSHPSIDGAYGPLSRGSGGLVMCGRAGEQTSEW